MADYHCKICGAMLENIKPDETITECEYCGNTITLPTADNEKKMAMLKLSKVRVPLLTTHSAG